MITIQRSDELDDSFFLPREFAELNNTVGEIVAAVATRGDAALAEYGARFDGVVPTSFLVSPDDARAAAEHLRSAMPQVYDALRYSYDLALRFAQRQRESFVDFETELEPGLFTGQKNIPVDRAGVYIPAGRFPLISTVIMTVAPAQAAGVRSIVLCSPPRVHPDNRSATVAAGKGQTGEPVIGCKPYIDSSILAAAHICGVERVYACGGAQAIAAMAYGTETIPAVDVIVGPGNAFVTEAKKRVYGHVGIDMLAGPTEVFIIADSSARPAWIAADLLAQAEHDVFAQPVLATPDAAVAAAVAAEIETQLSQLPTREIARKSIDSFGRIVITESLEEAADIANRKAPEHLELAVEAGNVRDSLVARVHNYGSLFIGHYSAEVLGDYAAGLNHTLPTAGSARFTGGLSVRAFLKTVTTLRADEMAPDVSGVQKSAAAAAALGTAEGLLAHAYAAQLRLTQ
ncbi:MAG: histidinol dehydrogenase [Treponema sp.]|nr:histidinol dehydrogenase [Treponema sp.]